jgi:hypothetical protein
MKLTQADFKQRRDLLLKNGANSIAIIATRAEMYRNRDDYKYRADSSFYYLTGFAEPEAVAVIETFEEGEEYSYSLFAVNVIVKWKSGMVIVLGLMVRLKSMMQMKHMQLIYG